jgi:hypothetical protein
MKLLIHLITHPSWVQIFSSTPCSQIPKSVFSIIVRDQVLRPYKTTGKIIVSCILIFTFSDARREDKRLWTESLYPFKINSETVVNLSEIKWDFGCRIRELQGLFPAQDNAAHTQKKNRIYVRISWAVPHRCIPVLKARGHLYHPTSASVLLLSVEIGG